MIRRRVREWLGALLVLAAMTSPGCRSSGAKRPPPVLVSPMATRDVAALTPDDVIETMRRAGFSDSEVLALGPALRNSLAGSGGARVQCGDKVEALFAVDGPRLHVSSRRTGSFIYPLARTRPTTAPRVAPAPVPSQAVPPGVPTARPAPAAAPVPPAASVPPVPPASPRIP